MADIKDFPEANFVWKGYATPDGQPDVGNLPAHRPPLMPGVTISCWQLTEEEKAEVLRTGEIWLWVWGRMPPAAVGGSTPFLPEVPVEEGA